MKLIFEKSVPGQAGVQTTRSDVATTINIKQEFLRDKPAELPELSELDVVRHFTELSHVAISASIRIFIRSAPAR